MAPSASTSALWQPELDAATHTRLLSPLLCCRVERPTLTVNGRSNFTTATTVLGVVEIDATVAP